MTNPDPDPSKSPKPVLPIALCLLAALMIIAWLFNTPPGLLGKSDAIGYAVCHRIGERSFHIGERPLSLCARCSGMFLAALFALIYQAATRQRYAGWPSKSIMIALSVFVFAFAFDGINSYIQYIRGSGLFYQTSNTMRAFTGAGMGIVLALVLYPTFNQTVWQRFDPAPGIQTWRQFVLLIVQSILIVLLLLSGNPLILYPLSLLSAASVLVLLTSLYAMMYLTLTKKENKATGWRHLVVPLLVGLIFSLIQISLLDFGRYSLTGSWQGFPAHLGR